MSILTKGTHIFVIDPDAAAGSNVVRITGITQFNPGGSPAEQIDDTDLEDLAKKFKKGMRTPGQATAQVKADPAVAAHVRLAEMADEDDDRNFIWAIGWSDGTAVPTFANGEITLPNTRTWYMFDAYVADFPFDFALNTVVMTALSLQRSGKGRWLKKGRAADEFS
jgi:hypothetical protein